MKMYFNQYERKAINENDSFYASFARLHIAIKRFEKAIMKTELGSFIKWLTKND